jgi:hypothetical protein
MIIMINVTLVSIAMLLVFVGAVAMSLTTQQPTKAITGPFTTSQNTTVQNSTANSSAASSIVTQPQTK